MLIIHEPGPCSCILSIWLRPYLSKCPSTWLCIFTLPVVVLQKRGGKEQCLLCRSAQDRRHSSWVQGPRAASANTHHSAGPAPSTQKNCSSLVFLTVIKLEVSHRRWRYASKGKHHHKHLPLFQTAATHCAAYTITYQEALRIMKYIHIEYKNSMRSYHEIGLKPMLAFKNSH